MCCMLSTFYVPSQIVANISGPSNRFFLIVLEALLEENITLYSSLSLSLLSSGWELVKYLESL